MKITMLCTMVQSFCVGRMSHPVPYPTNDVYESSHQKGTIHQVHFELSGKADTGHGQLAIHVENEQELAKWIPGQEYEVEIGAQVPSVKTVEPEEVPIEKYFEHLEKMGLIQRVPEPELNDGGITGMYSDLPLPVGTAEGGVQPVVDEDKPIAYVKRPMLDFDPPRAYPQAIRPLSSDLNVDADE